LNGEGKEIGEFGKDRCAGYWILDAGYWILDNH